MKKRFLSLFLALALCMGLVIPAFASTVPATAGEKLIGMEQRVYQEMKGVVEEVAAGKRSSTETILPMEKGEMEWTLQELGLSNFNDGKLEDALNEKVNEVLEKVYTCLELDLPFEMFWANNSWNWYWYEQHASSTVWITSLTISFDASPDYQGSSKTTVDPAKIAEANQVKETAEAIVQANAGKSDYEKLVAYRDEICARNTYNDDAYNALKKDDSVYGNPWQSIHVFDNDSSTNVLCEGYAKAFKYLCDLSDFDGNVTCYIVEGMEGDDRHMWNVVRMEDEKFYLADITYIDTGASDSLFLAGASGSGREYTISAGSNQYTYIYREDQEDLFTDGYLPLSPTAYSPENSAKPQPTPTFTDVDAGDWFAEHVAWAAETDITTGTSSTAFSPTRNCRHDQILTFLYRAQREDGTASSNDDMALAIEWAQDEGMIDDSFDPKAECTRADAVNYIWQAFGSVDPETEAGFTDVADDADYAAAANWAFENGIVDGTSKTETVFSPNTVCNRATIVTLLHRAYVEEVRLNVND